MRGSILVVVDVDITAADGNIAAAIGIFFLVVVSSSRTVVAKTRDVAADLRPPAAPADEHQERLAAPGALLLRLTYNQIGQKKEKYI